MGSFDIADGETVTIADGEREGRGDPINLDGTLNIDGTLNTADYLTATVGEVTVTGNDATLVIPLGRRTSFTIDETRRDEFDTQGAGGTQ